MKYPLLCAAAVSLAACGSGQPSSGEAGPAGAPAPTETELPSANAPAGTRPSGQPALVTYEGRIEEGTECAVLHTPDGRRWSFTLGEADFAPGDYVEITGEVADASFCMEGEGTLIPQSIEAASPPARDRDPARAGGLAVTSDYVIGSWTAKGVDADCDRPDFDITANANGMAIIETSVNGVPTTGAVDVGDTPALQFDEPLPSVPIETRGPDGLALLPPQSGEITIAGHDIEGDGVVFVKCA